MHIEPDGDVRGIPIYEGVVGNLSKEDPLELWRRVVARHSEPEVQTAIRSIHSYADWARVARELDRRYARETDLVRIGRRPAYSKECEL